MSWKPEIEEIAERRRLAKQQGGPDGIARQHSKGRLTIRERINALVDAGSFDEVGEGAGGSERGSNGELIDFTPANFVLGFAKIDGRRVIVGGEDFTIKGGSPSPAGLRKSVYTEDLALQYKLPLVRLHEGAGGSVGGSGGSSLPGPVFAPSRFRSVAKTLATVPVATAGMGASSGTAGLLALFRPIQIDRTSPGRRPRCGRARHGRKAHQG